MISFSKVGSDWGREDLDRAREERMREHIKVTANLGVQAEQGDKKSQGNWWDLRY